MGSDYWIDPDLFEIDLDDVAVLRRMLGGDDDVGPATISMAFDDVLALETCVMAADTYAHRKGERARCAPTDEEFADVDRCVSGVRAFSPYLWPSCPSRVACPSAAPS